MKSKMGEQPMQPIVVILMGSRADMAHCQEIAAALSELGLDSEMRIGSAHKTPGHLMSLIQAYEADPRPKLYVTVAGRSNALSGFVDAQVTAPVIACPPLSSTFAGADVYSSLRMPSGVAPAVVLEPKGAALLAAKILGLADVGIQRRVADRQEQYVEQVLSDDQEISSI
jgi:5-(carboxyamino)imidazole ribonucleotide mutase